ncbi:DMT family transporter [Halocatena marina]|uniref:DMT family transporter n=1 Tax=Halocatena marina TaxID=2934937 RepID=A0ABD5YX03_9EURY
MTLSRRRRAVPLASLLGAGAALGISTNLAKLAAEAGVDPLAFLAWSVIGATAVLVGVSAVRHRLPPLNARTTEYFVIAGLVGLAAPNLLSFAAVSHVGAGFVALSIAFPPLFTYIGALLLGMERFQPRRATGVVLALGGAVLLAVLKLSEPDVDAFWVAATLSAPILLAVGNIYRTARWPEGLLPMSSLLVCLPRPGPYFSSSARLWGLSSGASRILSRRTHGSRHASSPYPRPDHDVLVHVPPVFRPPETRRASLSQSPRLGWCHRRRPHRRPLARGGPIAGARRWRRSHCIRRRSPHARRPEGKGRDSCHPDRRLTLLGKMTVQP